MANVILMVDPSVEDRDRVLSALGPDFTVVHAPHAEAALKLAAERAFDLILAEIELPGMDGLRFLAEVRGGGTPNAGASVVFLTRRDRSPDKAAAFTMGADDYVVKPLDPVEFRARILARARVRRLVTAAEDTLRVGGLTFHLSRHRATADERGAPRDLRLTPIEFKILHYLAQRPGMAFTREQILAAVSSEPTDVFDRSVDCHVSNLRKKLARHAKWIESVRGVGYAFTLPETERKRAA